MDNRKYIIKHILLCNAAVEKAKRRKAPAAENGPETRRKCAESHYFQYDQSWYLLLLSVSYDLRPQYI